MKRCAIYTRKSTEEGLEQAFNSLDAQREACEAYINSQKHEGWKVVRRRFDDGGFSGGSMDRPSLIDLMQAIERREIDVVVVYKVDRLTRSLADFVKIVERFDQYDVSFISVTQQFNTTSSMGRLTLNVLLSFAQFEREVTGERIRDKIAASKRKGLWMGGPVPLGYDTRNKKLVINEDEATSVRMLFRRYLDLGNVRDLQREAERSGLVTKRRVRSDGSMAGGKSCSRGHLYKMLSNPIYAGLVRHRDEFYPGQHEAIVELEVWRAVQAMLAKNAVQRQNGMNARMPSLLTGLIFDEEGDRLCPTHASKGKRRYRYYVSKSLACDAKQSDGWRLPAKELEHAVISALTDFLSDRHRLMETVLPGERPAARLAAAMATATALASRLQSASSPVAKTLLTRIVLRIDIREAAISIAMSRNALLERLGVNTTGADNSAAALLIEVPISLRRRGIETKLILKGEGTPTRKPDPHLCRLIARGHTWFDDVAGGISVAAIAAREQMDPSDVGKILRFAFLAPDIVQAILAGHQPIELTARKLRKLKSIPSDWQQQRALLGFVAS